LQDTSFGYFLMSKPPTNRSRKVGASGIAAGATKRQTTPFKKVAGASSLYRYVGSDGSVKDGSYYMIAKFKGSKTPVKESLNTTDLALAKRKLLAAKQRRKTGAGDITLMALGEAYKAGRNGKNQKTIQWVLTRLERECPFRGTVVRKILPTEISRFISGLKLEPRSNNLFFQTLKGIFEEGVINSYLEKNPMEQLRKALRKKENRKLPKAPTKEEFHAILKQIREQKFSDTAKASADVVEFLGSAGLGVAEAANLDWRHVDLKNEWMQIQRRKTGKYFEVPIYDELKPLLERLHSEANNPSTGKVFKVENPKVAMASACKKLGFPHFTARNYRSMHIIALLRDGLDYKLVSKYQGHQDGGMLIITTYSEAISKNDGSYEQEQLKRLKAKRAAAEQPAENPEN
jgi:integrase